MARLSVTDAAVRLNVSTDTIRRRLRKGELHATRDNHGQWWLDLPDDAAPEAHRPSAAERLVPAMLAPAQQPMQVPMQSVQGVDPALADALRLAADLAGQLRAERERSAAAESQVHALRRLIDVQLAELRALVAAVHATGHPMQAVVEEDKIRVRRQARHSAWRWWWKL